MFNFDLVEIHNLKYTTIGVYSIDSKIADQLLAECKRLTHDYEMGGRKIIQFGRDYDYSNLNHIGREKETFIEAIIECSNLRFKTNFNSVLLNLYEANKLVGIGKHSDSERGLEYDPMVLSISLGSSDFFNIVGNNEYDDELLSIEVNHGTVVMMGRGCQQHYQHYIKQSIRQEDRISLTLRNMI